MKKISLRQMLIIAVMTSIVVALATSIIVSLNKTKEKLTLETKEELYASATALKHYYQRELQTNGDIPYEHDYVDQFKESGVELTLFKDNVRYFTSILNENGQRIEETEMNVDIWQDIQNKKDYFSTNTVINNKNYYVYYTPLVNENGEVIGSAFAGKSCDNLNEAQLEIVMYCISFSVLIIIIFLLLVLYFSNRIAKPLGVVVKNIDKLSQGIIGDNEDTKSFLKETTNLINSANQLDNNTNDIVSKIVDTCNILADRVSSITENAVNSSSSTEQVADAMEELAKGSCVLAENVQNINNQTIEMGYHVGDISNSIKDLSQSSDKMLEVDEKTIQCINQVEEKSLQTSENADIVSNHIEDTNIAIGNIKKAVDLISDIAERTTLLALNASIEASHAGEFGKGFSVVASEINKLASQSSDGAKEIERIVEDIVNKFVTTKKYTDEINVNIKSERELLILAKEEFNVLNKEINNCGNSIKEITEKTVMLENIKNNIVNNVSDLSAISEENSASNEEVCSSIVTISEEIEEISNSAKNIDNLVNELNGVVSKYTIK